MPGLPPQELAFLGVLCRKLAEKISPRVHSFVFG